MHQSHAAEELEERRRRLPVEENARTGIIHEREEERSKVINEERNESSQGEAQFCADSKTVEEVELVGDDYDNGLQEEEMRNDLIFFYEEEEEMKADEMILSEELEEQKLREDNEDESIAGSKRSRLQAELSMPSSHSSASLKILKTD